MAPMKTVMKASKPMKAAAKPMKAKKASAMKTTMKAKKASKVGSKLRVWNGKSAEKTAGGNKKEDLMKNKRGRIVSKAQSKIGKARYHQNGLAKWVQSLAMAKKSMGLTGFVAPKKGSALYNKAKEIYGKK